MQQSVMAKIKVKDTFTLSAEYRLCGAYESMKAHCKGKTSLVSASPSIPIAETPYSIDDIPTGTSKGIRREVDGVSNHRVEHQEPTSNVGMSNVLIVPRIESGPQPITDNSEKECAIIVEPAVENVENLRTEAPIERESVRETRPCNPAAVKAEGFTADVVRPIPTSQFSERSDNDPSEASGSHFANSRFFPPSIKSEGEMHVVLKTAAQNEVVLEDEEILEEVISLRHPALEEQRPTKTLIDDSRPEESATADDRHHCHWCRKQFSSQESWERHFVRAHGHSPYGCPRCRQRFQRQHLFNRHVEANNCKPISMHSEPISDETSGSHSDDVQVVFHNINSTDNVETDHDVSDKPHGVENSVPCTFKCTSSSELNDHSREQDGEDASFIDGTRKFEYFTVHMHENMETLATDEDGRLSGEEAKNKEVQVKGEPLVMRLLQCYDCNGFFLGKLLSTHMRDVHGVKEVDSSRIKQFVARTKRLRNKSRKNSDNLAVSTQPQKHVKDVVLKSVCPEISSKNPGFQDLTSMNVDGADNEVKCAKCTFTCTSIDELNDHSREHDAEAAAFIDSTHEFEYFTVHMHKNMETHTTEEDGEGAKNKEAQVEGEPVEMHHLQCHVCYGSFLGKLSLSSHMRDVHGGEEAGRSRIKQFVVRKKRLINKLRKNSNNLAVSSQPQTHVKDIVPKSVRPEISSHMRKTNVEAQKQTACASLDLNATKSKQKRRKLSPTIAINAKSVYQENSEDTMNMKVQNQKAKKQGACLDLNTGHSNEELNVADDISDLSSYRDQLMALHSKLMVAKSKNLQTKDEKDSGKNVMVEGDRSKKESQYANSEPLIVEDQKAPSSVASKTFSKEIVESMSEKSRDHKESQCFLCRKQFSNCGQLNRHLVTVHNQLPCQCSGCSKGFGDINRHGKCKLFPGQSEPFIEEETGSNDVQVVFDDSATSSDKGKYVVLGEPHTSAGVAENKMKYVKCARAPGRPDEFSSSAVGKDTLFKNTLQLAIKNNFVAKISKKTTKDNVEPNQTRDVSSQSSNNYLYPDVDIIKESKNSNVIVDVNDKKVFSSTSYQRLNVNNQKSLKALEPWENVSVGNGHCNLRSKRHSPEVDSTTRENFADTELCGIVTEKNVKERNEDQENERSMNNAEDSDDKLIPSGDISDDFSLSDNIDDSHIEEGQESTDQLSYKTTDIYKELNRRKLVVSLQRIDFGNFKMVGNRSIGLAAKNEDAVESKKSNANRKVPKSRSRTKTKESLKRGPVPAVDLDKISADSAAKISNSTAKNRKTKWRECNLCGNYYFDKSTLNKHLKLSHGVRKSASIKSNLFGLVRCKQCMKRFRNLKSHMANSKRCQIGCKKNRKAKNRLKTIRKSLSVVNNYRIICQNCRAVFTNKTEYSQHLSSKDCFDNSMRNDDRGDEAEISLFPTRLSPKVKVEIGAGIKTEVGGDASMWGSMSGVKETRGQRLRHGFDAETSIDTTNVKVELIDDWDMKELNSTNPEGNLLDNSIKPRDQCLKSRQQIEKMSRKMPCDDSMRIDTMNETETNARYNCEFCPSSYSNMTQFCMHLRYIHKVNPTIYKRSKFENAQETSPVNVKRQKKRTNPSDMLRNESGNSEIDRLSEPVDENHADIERDVSVFENCKEKDRKAEARFRKTNLLAKTLLRARMRKANNARKVKRKCRESYQSHYPSEKSTTDVISQCFLCHKQFFDLYTLNRHLINVHDRFPYVCSRCSKGFLQRYQLSRHFKDNNCGLVANEESNVETEEAALKPSSNIVKWHSSETMENNRETSQEERMVNSVPLSAFDNKSELSLHLNIEGCVKGGFDSDEKSQGPEAALKPSSNIVKWHSSETMENNRETSQEERMVNSVPLSAFDNKSELSLHLNIEGCVKGGFDSDEKSQGPSAALSEMNTDDHSGSEGEEPAVTSDQERNSNSPPRTRLSLIKMRESSADVKETTTETGEDQPRCVESHNAFSLRRMRDVLRKKIKRTAHENDGLRCVECRKIFSYKRTLLRHMRDIHGGQSQRKPERHEKPLTCVECRLTFCYRRTLKRHVRDLHGQGKRKPETHEKPLTCVECRLTFSYKRTLKRHVLNLHGNRKAAKIKKNNLVGQNKREIRTTGETLTCVASKRRTLKRHVKDLHGNIQSATRLQTSSEMSDFNPPLMSDGAEKIIAEEADLFCKDDNISETSGSDSEQKPYLDNGMEERSQGKPKVDSNKLRKSTRPCKLKYERELKGKCSKCRECGRMFFDKSTLNRHVKFVHMNIKALQCPDCPHTCSRNDYLMKHVQAHHKGKLKSLNKGKKPNLRIDRSATVARRERITRMSSALSKGFENRNTQEASAINAKKSKRRKMKKKRAVENAKSNATLEDMQRTDEILRDSHNDKSLIGPNPVDENRVCTQHSGKILRPRPLEKSEARFSELNDENSVYMQQTEECLSDSHVIKLEIVEIATPIEENRADTQWGDEILDVSCVVKSEIDQLFTPTDGNSIENDEIMDSSRVEIEDPIDENCEQRNDEIFTDRHVEKSVIDEVYTPGDKNDVDTQQTDEFLKDTHGEKADIDQLSTPNPWPLC